MRAQETAVYREIQRNTEAVMKAIDIIRDKVCDEQLALQLSSQTVGYSELHNAAIKQLVAAKIQPYSENSLSDMLLKTKLQCQTLLNTSTAHLAELLIKSSSSEALKMEKVLRHSEGAGEKSMLLAKQLMELEERNAESLKEYL